MDLTDAEFDHLARILASPDSEEEDSEESALPSFPPHVELLLAETVSPTSQDYLALEFTTFPAQEAAYRRSGAGTFWAHLLASMNPLSPVVQEALVTSTEDPSVLEVLAANPSITPDVQVKIRERASQEWADRDAKRIFTILARNPGLVVDLEGFFDPHSSESIRLMHVVPEGLQRWAVEAGDSYVRYVLATHKSLLPEVQRLLVADDNLHTALAANPALASDVMEVLLSGGRGDVFRNLSRNSSFYWTLDLPASLYHTLNPDAARVACRILGVDPLEWEALLPTWTGSLRELAQAVELTQR